MKKRPTRETTDNTNTRICHTAITLTVKADESRVDSRLLAQRLGVLHRSSFRLIADHLPDFEEFGKVRFEIAALPESGTGQRERFALLNEDQAYLLLTYSRNTTKTRALKVKLVQAFSSARKAAELRRTEYLPSYHSLHEQVALLAGDSPHAQFVHQNVNKAINRAVGIEPGTRRALPVPQQSLLVLAQSLAAKALAGAHDHHDGYRLAKAALQRLTGLLEVSQ